MYEYVIVMENEEKTMAHVKCNGVINRFAFIQDYKPNDLKSGKVVFLER